MDQFVQYILAMLLTVMSPGQSTYSRVVIQSCDTACQQAPLCENQHDWRCKQPQFNQSLFDSALKRHMAKGLDKNQAAKQATLESYTRPETFEEGLVRYVVIANAIADVSKELSQSLCKKRCTSPDESQLKTCHQGCVKNAPWLWGRVELALMIATVTNQESGYRADVHGGAGALGRGDCAWQYSNGKRATPFAKGASPISGTCKSVCLGQINLGNGSTPTGLKADDLVGVDYNSTKRCLTTVAQVLSKSRMMCTRWNKTSGDWSKATFSAYGTGSSCVVHQKKIVQINGSRVVKRAYRVKDSAGKVGIVWNEFPPDNAISNIPVEAPWPGKRAAIFNSYMQSYTKKTLSLSADTKDILADKNISSAINVLMTTNTAVNWMFPVTLSVDPAKTPVETAKNE